MLGQHIILLNSEQVAIALLEKRSQKYSDRPVFSVADLYVLVPFQCSVPRADGQTKVQLRVAILFRTLWAEV